MSDEKTEDASEQKLEKAHEDGNFPKSQEFCSAFVFGAVLLTVISCGPLMLDQFRVLISTALAFGSSLLTMEELWSRIGTIYLTALWLLIPVSVVGVVAGTVGMIAQIGFHVSFKPLAPKFDNISPVKGIKKIFSVKAVLELLQMMVRACIIGAVGWWLIRGAITLFSGAAYQTVPVIGEIAWRLMTRLMEFSLLCFVVMSGGDYAIQRWQFMKSQRMSKDEVKREYKESEGDPMLKGERMRLARENAQNAKPGPSLDHAKAILANPTHYAVAIAYEPGTYDVPVVVARGADLEAKEIRELATLAGIPIFINPPLARALYKTPLNMPIPREYFAVIAALLCWLQTIEKLKQSQVGIAPVPGSLG